LEEGLRRKPEDPFEELRWQTASGNERVCKRLRDLLKAVRCKLIKVLRLKEAPYAVTLLVAALGWSVTHGVDRLTQMPIIEYKLDDPSDHGSRLVKCEVTNICAQGLQKPEFISQRGGRKNCND